MNRDFLSESLPWPSTADRVHCGVPLGNGLFGALLWGDGGRIRLTLNRADYWDHHGGHQWPREATYENLRKCLRTGDDRKMRRLFEGRDAEGERPVRPTRLPMGRIDLDFESSPSAVSADLDLSAGEATVRTDVRGGPTRIRCVVPRELPAFCCMLEGPYVSDVNILACPVDDERVWEHLRALGYPKPVPYGGKRSGGWVQQRPDEPALVVAWRRKETGTSRVEIFGCAVYGDTPGVAKSKATRMLLRLARKGYDRTAGETALRWRDYWRTACAVRLPDRDLELLHFLGLYKLAGLSMPGTPAATLQGPWVEEHQLPPWGSDYHFNINVQECYWPAFGGNHPEALEPLIELLESWKPKLREYARIFTGCSDGLMLPHAVDDRCTCMGGFWTGAVDHGSTAWVGQLLWQYYRYTMDEDVLAETVYPFMKSAMRVYEQLLEDKKGRLALEVGVSPEFGGAMTQAYGRNASFQLAAIHWLCRTLDRAAERLSVDSAARRKWRDIDKRLPLGAIVKRGKHAQIGIWEGRALDESHRHHSHLAAIHPFDALDYQGSEEDRRLVENTMRQWTVQGTGAWSGWSFPWASILCTRTGRAHMAVELLRLFRQAFLNEGYASLHDARFPGLTTIDRRKDLMQIEAALAASAAVMETLAYTSQGVLRVFEGMPDDWPDASFENLRVEGAFLVSGERYGGRVRRIGVRSEAGGTLGLANPWHDENKGARIPRALWQDVLTEGPILTVTLEPGEEVSIERD